MKYFLNMDDKKQLTEYELRKLILEKYVKNNALQDTSRRLGLSDS